MLGRELVVSYPAMPGGGQLGLGSRGATCQRPAAGSTGTRDRSAGIRCQRPPKGQTERMLPLDNVPPRAETFPSGKPGGPVYFSRGDWGNADKRLLLEEGSTFSQPNKPNAAFKQDRAVPSSPQGPPEPD